jgi:hypothetical protein
MKKKAIAAFSLLTLAALFVLMTAASAQQTGPKFFIRDKEPDLGDFYEGADIEHVFTIRNNGVGDLHILSVRPG